MAVKQSTRDILEYLQKHAHENVTSQQIAEALDLTKKSVDASFTTGIQRKKLGFREESEIQLPDGTHAKVKYLRLSEAGMEHSFDEPEKEAGE